MVVLLTALGPVITGTALTKDEVVGAEEWAKRPGAERVHCSGLEIDEHSTRNVLVGCYSGIRISDMR